MLSLFYAVAIIAAGSNASPCKVSGSSVSATVPSGSGPSNAAGGYLRLANSKNSLQLAGQASNIQLTNDTGASVGQQFIVAASASNPAPIATDLASSPSLVPVASGACPMGFLNAVFNTGASKNQGWPETVWESLSSNGINDWIGFSLGTLDTKSTYTGPDGHPARTMPALDAAQIHVVMDPTDVDSAVTMMKSNSAPQYLELFNEPDYSYQGITPITDAKTSAQDLAPLFNMPHPNTSYISPALAYANSDWLPTFRDHCNKCFDQIPIIAEHIYSPDPAAVMGFITQLHNTWPDKKIWLTELSPSSAQCTLQSTGSGPGTVTDYINTLIPQIVGLGYVEKIFWNSGEWSTGGLTAGGDGSCNPSLTDAQGNPTEVLKALHAVCGGTGGSVTA